MNKSIIVFVIILFNVGISYSANPIVTDSTSILAYTNEFTSLGKNVSDYCTLSSDKSVDAGTILLVTGIKECEYGTYSHSKSDFYEVFYKNETYYIEKSKLSFIDSLDRFDAIKNLPEGQYQRFNEHSKYLGKLLYVDKSTKIFNFLDKCKNQGLAILDYSIYDESEYTEGTSFKIEYYNPTKKTIKYIYTYLIGKNAVGDPVSKAGKSIIKVSSIGPIKSKENGSYSFKYVWFSDLVETVKISSIVVQYMDGSTVTIKNPKSIILPTSDYKYLFE